MSEFVADSSQLYNREVGFSIVERIVGSTSHGHFNLVDRLTNRLDPYEVVTLVGELTVLVTSTASPTNALTAWVATQPQSETEYPTKPEQIATYNNHVFARDGVFATAKPHVLELTEGVTKQLKPEQLGASRPCVVYHTEVSGADNQTVVLLTLKGRIRVDGVGYVRSWSA